MIPITEPMPAKTKVVKKSRQTAKRIVDATHKQAQALKLRLEGKSLSEIAEAVGYANASGAWHAIQTGLAATLSEPSQELRELELARLDLMWKHTLPKIRKGVASAVLAGIHIVQQRARLLGLYAPKGILVRIENPEGMSDEELIDYCLRTNTPLLPGLADLQKAMQASAAAAPRLPAGVPPSVAVPSAPAAPGVATATGGTGHGRTASP